MITTWMRFGAFAALLGTATFSQPAASAWLDFDVRLPPAAGVQVIPVQASDAERFNRLEAQMRALTGQVEELQFQVRQLTQQLNGSQGAPAQQGAVPLPQPPANAQRLGQEAPGLAPASSGGLQPLDLSSLARSGGQQAALGAASSQPTGDPFRDYQTGYDYILNGNYAAAESLFRQFVQTYPGDPRAADAQFWIGESYFQRGDYHNAARAFLDNSQSHPEAAKAPESMLKLGLSLAGLGEREAACQTYAAVLKQYPDAPNSLRQRVASEQAVAAC